MMVLKELHRLGVVVIEGFVANLGPPISPVSMIGNKILNTTQGTARHSIQKLAPGSPNDRLIEWFYDLGRYRVAIAVDYNWDKEGRTRLARYWYSVTFETAPPTSRLYHHLARLARPIAQQPVFNSQFTSAEDDNLTRCEALNQETYYSQPWELYPALLKAVVGLTGKHMGGETRKPLSGLAPFSEDFAMRGLLWADEYYRDSWFENEEINEEQKYQGPASLTEQQKDCLIYAIHDPGWGDDYYAGSWFGSEEIDEEEKYHELASMTEHREERILWLAGRGFLIYDPP
jgi:hypothetical protein